MTDYSYRILPPRAGFAETITEAEGAVMGRHWSYIEGLIGAGRVHFVGRCLNGDWGLVVFSATDDAAADRTAAADPAVAEGLMQVEVRAFRRVHPVPA